MTLYCPTCHTRRAIVTWTPGELLCERVCKVRLGCDHVIYRPLALVASRVFEALGWRKAGGP